MVVVMPAAALLAVANVLRSLLLLLTVLLLVQVLFMQLLQTQSCAVVRAIAMCYVLDFLSRI